MFTTMSPKVAELCQLAQEATEQKASDETVKRLIDELSGIYQRLEFLYTNNLSSELYYSLRDLYVIQAIVSSLKRIPIEANSPNLDFKTAFLKQCDTAIWRHKDRVQLADSCYLKLRQIQRDVKKYNQDVMWGKVRVEHLEDCIKIKENMWLISVGTLLDTLQVARKWVTMGNKLNQYEQRALYKFAHDIMTYVCPDLWEKIENTDGNPYQFSAPELNRFLYQFWQAFAGFKTAYIQTYGSVPVEEYTSAINCVNHYDAVTTPIKDIDNPTERLMALRNAMTSFFASKPSSETAPKKTQFFLGHFLNEIWAIQELCQRQEIRVVYVGVLQRIIQSIDAIVDTGVKAWQKQKDSLDVTKDDGGNFRAYREAIREFNLLCDHRGANTRPSFFFRGSENALLLKRIQFRIDDCNQNDELPNKLSREGTKKVATTTASQVVERPELKNLDITYYTLARIQRVITQYNQCAETKMELHIDNLSEYVMAAKKQLEADMNSILVQIKTATEQVVAAGKMFNSAEQQAVHRRMSNLFRNVCNALWSVIDIKHEHENERRIFAPEANDYLYKVHLAFNEFKKAFNNAVTSSEEKNPVVVVKDFPYHFDMTGIVKDSSNAQERLVMIKTTLLQFFSNIPQKQISSDANQDRFIEITGQFWNEAWAIEENCYRGKIRASFLVLLRNTINLILSICKDGIDDWEKQNVAVERVKSTFATQKEYAIKFETFYEKFCVTSSVANLSLFVPAAEDPTKSELLHQYAKSLVEMHNKSTREDGYHAAYDQPIMLQIQPKPLAASEPVVTEHKPEPIKQAKAKAKAKSKSTVDASSRLLSHTSYDSDPDLKAGVAMADLSITGNSYGSTGNRNTN